MAAENTLPMAKQINDNQWKVLKEMTNLLKPFQKNQKHLEGEKYPTSCRVPCTIHQCCKSIEAGVTNSDFPSIQAVSTSMQIQFEKDFGESNNPTFNAEIVCGH